eukprot:2471635-Amphidinium_carterae.1
MLAHLEAAQQHYTAPCFVQLDIQNAFGSLDRQSMVDCLLPALAPFQPDGTTALPLLPDHLRLWLANHLKALLTVPCPHNAAQAPLQSYAGVPQGGQKPLHLTTDCTGVAAADAAVDAPSPPQLSLPSLPCSAAAMPEGSRAFAAGADG